MHRSRGHALRSRQDPFQASRAHQDHPSSPPRESLSRQATNSSTGQNFVWIRVDVVDAIWNNHGTLPRDWKPSSRKRGRNQTSSLGTSWDWMRARVIQSSLASNSSSPHRFRAKNNARTVLATFTVDDDLFAPSHLSNATVSLSYDPSDLVDPLVCNANTWWNVSSPNKQPVPPNDLTVLTHLHEPSVVFCLHQRYQQEQIYTYTGKILLALNPFRIIEGMYGEPVMQQYWQPHDLGRPPPHVYAIAQDAYDSMRFAVGNPSQNGVANSTSDQSILVSGESGSGKTVTTKIIMGYLATQSQRTSALQAGELHQHHKEGIESQILQSNPILESFGNARTVRNDNSSRFGKFMELLFTPSGTLVSASIETYLLEKVRLISQAPGERNYHVFYELLAGVPQRQRQALRIANVSAQDFRMTASSGTFDRRDAVDDRDTYKDLRKALDTMGFSALEQHDLMLVACALLHTSNIQFRESTSIGGDEGSELVSSSSLRASLALLGVPLEALSNALCLCAIEARGEVFHKNLTVSQATKAVEALIKATYDALFTHIVKKINDSIAAKHTADQPLQSLSRIGVLDIFGFESFAVNSFEQLCINYCNEALQQQFNRFVFKLEQEEYNREGIEWSFIEFPDNQDILDLIEKKREGILSILDEQCRLSTCTDASFCRAVQDKCKDHPRFSATMTQRSNLTFSIHHYAGVVTYDSRNFLEKNKDELPKETTELLTSSSVPFLAYLGELLSDSANSSSSSGQHRPPSPTSSVSSFPSRNGISPTNRKQTPRSSSSMLRESVGGQFSQQLRELRRRIDATTPHYVRCLKPNDDLIPYQFQAHIIADQLRCAGVLEAIRVSRVGLPHRFFHESFIQRYGILEFSRKKTPGRTIPKERCVTLVNSLIPQVLEVVKSDGDDSGSTNLRDVVSLGMQMGHKKVFLRRRVFEALEYLRNKRLGKSATQIQKHIRRFLAQLHYYDIYMAAITLQCFARKLTASRLFTHLKEYNAAIRIQATFRKFLAETAWMAARLIAQFCQTYRRGMVARKLHAIMRVERQALVIQRCWRRFRDQSEFKQMSWASVVLQCCWRQRLARLALRELRLEARNLDAVVAERDHFKEESLRLKREVELLRRQNGPLSESFYDEEVQILRREVARLKQEQSLDAGTVPDEEVEHLRMEVERLQNALVQQNQILNPRAHPEKPPKSVVVRKASSSWSLFGSKKDDAASTTSSGNGNSYSPLPALRRALSRNPSHQTPESPRSRNTKRMEVTPQSWASNGFSPGMSNTSMSLLDAERNTEVADYQLRKTAEYPTSPSRDLSRIYSTTTMPHPSEMAVENASLLEQNSFRSNDDLHSLHDSVRDSDSRRVVEILRSAKDPCIVANEGDEEGRTALHIAVSANDLKLARALIDNGAIVNVQDFAGETPLHLAVSAPMTSLLLEVGKANPNIPNLDGVCALHVAVQRRDSGSVRLLLKHGAKVDAADNIRWLTPIHLAAMPDPDQSQSSPATRQARATIARLLCELDNADLNYQDSESNTPLHYAVQIEGPDACDVINTLLEKGASPSVCNSRKQQPLLLLCHNEALRSQDVFQECLHSMLFNGADPNQQSNTGCTPLHLSLYHRDTDSAVQLVSQGAELHLMWRKPKRWTAFWDDMGTSEVLTLDMVMDEHSLHRILAAITRPQKLAPPRSWCMHCKSPLGSFARALHCRHCGRHVCSACSRCSLSPNYFLKSFEIYEPSWVCVVCEKILVSRKEDASSGTHPMSSVGDEDDRYM